MGNNDRRIFAFSVPSSDVSQTTADTLPPPSAQLLLQIVGFAVAGQAMNIAGN